MVRLLRSNFRDALRTLIPSLTVLGVSTVCAVAAAPGQQGKPTATPKSEKLPRQLDRGIVWQRDATTGELRAVTAGPPSADRSRNAPPGAASLRVVTDMVPVTCIVSTPDGAAIPGLRREDFRVFEDGVERPVAYFDASMQPASVAIVVDASPSVLRDSQQMKDAAEALIGALAPLDEAAIVDFSAHTYLQLPFTPVRESVRRAVARIDVRALLGDAGGSNIYEAVYLAAQELFGGRTGRKAIVLLTDGQDSGLGLTLDPSSVSPRRATEGRPANRLTFDDVARLLASQDIQIFAVSTENRPKMMTPEWLARHEGATLITADARSSEIPPYTLYLAELARRAGGQLYFLREAETMADAFRKIAEKIRAEYTLGFYPGYGQHLHDPDASGAKGEWRSLRVELADQPGARVSHRAAYYVPPTP